MEDFLSWRRADTSLVCLQWSSIDIVLDEGVTQPSCSGQPGDGVCEGE